MEVDAMWAGLVGATMALVGLLKSKFKWVDGKEEALAFTVPVVLATAAKLLDCQADFALLPWKQMLTGAFFAGLVAQLGHDKLWEPVLKPALGWFTSKFAK